VRRRLAAPGRLRCTSGVCTALRRREGRPLRERRGGIGGVQDAAGDRERRYERVAGGTLLAQNTQALSFCRGMSSIALNMMTKAAAALLSPLAILEKHAYSLAARLCY